MVWSGPVTGLVANSQVGATALYGDSIFYFEREGLTLSKVPIAGGPSQVLFDVMVTEWIGSIAVDDQWVYFTRSDFHIFKLGHDGGDVIDVICREEAGFDRELRVDGNHLYWIHDLDGNPPGVMATAK